MLTTAKSGLFRILRHEARMIASEVFLPAFVSGLYATLVVLLHKSNGIETLPMGIVAVVGTAMAILLGFRTSSAYNRWWEARMVWGGIVNDSRTLARQAVVFLPPKDLFTAKRIVHRQIAWCYGLRSMLLGEKLPELAAALIGEEEMLRVQWWRSFPNSLLAEQGVDIQKADLAPMRFVQLDRTLSRLTTHLGKCERIKNTPFPPQYDAMVSHVIGLFTLLLPLALVSMAGYLTVALSVVIVAIFRTINGVARVLQSPFSGSISDTPMLAICRAIEIDLRQQLNERSTPPMIQPEDGILP